MELKLRFVDSNNNFWLLDAGVKQLDRQLQFDGLISPGHLNGTPIDLYHCFLIGGDHTLLSNLHVEAIGKSIYLHQRISEYCFPPLLPMIRLPSVMTVHWSFFYH